MIQNWDGSAYLMYRRQLDPGEYQHLYSGGKFQVSLYGPGSC
jgi:hypothetical protein